MANLIAIVGDPGTGKSYSLRNLDPAHTLIINVASKPLPWRGWKKQYTTGKNYVAASTHQEVVKVIMGASKMDWVKNIVIEDFRYLMSFQFMALKGQTGYDKWDIIADAGFSPVNAARKQSADLNIIFICHSSEPDKKNNVRKIQTSGAMVDNHINLEGMFTIVLFTSNRIDETGTRHYEFLTNDGISTTAKSPIGMFEELLIPNDLQIILNNISSYYDGDVQEDVKQIKE